jgi:hypothetical protein
MGSSEIDFIVVHFFIVMMKGTKGSLEGLKSLCTCDGVINA